MKSAYELAMERLEKASPTARLTDAQRDAIAQIESSYRAKIAEREVFLQSLLAKAVASGNAGEADDLRLQLSREVRRLEEEREDKKSRVR